MTLHADLDHKDIMIMCLVKQYSPLDSLPTDGALGHPVSAHLTRAVTAEEDHVLQPVQAHGAHGLLLYVSQLLLQLHYVLRLVVYHHTIGLVIFLSNYEYNSTDNNCIN